MKIVIEFKNQKKYFMNYRVLQNISVVWLFCLDFVFVHYTTMTHGTLDVEDLGSIPVGAIHIFSTTYN